MYAKVRITDVVLHELHKMPQKVFFHLPENSFQIFQSILPTRANLREMGDVVARTIFASRMLLIGAAQLSHLTSPLPSRMREVAIVFHTE